MKKNLISVIILALTLVNVVLTALVVFTLLPETKKANALITDVCSAIDLELNSGAASGTSNVPLDKVEVFTINGGESMTLNFKTGSDGTHYAVLKSSLSLNTTSDNYKTYSPEILTTKEDLIKSTITQAFGKYTIEAYRQNPEAVKSDILKELQNMFGKDYVVGVNFAQVTTE